MSRKDKVAEEIRREVSLIIQGEVQDPRLGFTTITRVELTPDLRFARIYYSVYGQEDKWIETQKGLDHANGFIRRLLGERLGLRFVPEILFDADHSSEYSIRIEEELNKLKIENQPQKINKKAKDDTKKAVVRVKKKRK